MGRNEGRDIADAGHARERYRAAGIDTTGPEARACRLLGPDEHLVAERRAVVLERRQSRRPMPTGDLLVTTRRLLVVGATTLDIDLDEIEDAGLLGERIVLLLRGGGAVAIEADRPRLLRVEIAAARARRAAELAGVV